MKTYPWMTGFIDGINSRRAQRFAEDQVFERAESDAIERGASPDNASLGGVVAVMRYKGPERFWGVS